MSSSRSRGSLMRTSIGTARLSAQYRSSRRDDRLVRFGRSAGPVRGRIEQAGDMRNLVDLANRRGGGIEVALIWNRHERTLLVFAHDSRTDEEVAIPVSGDEASEVYSHPFAYAHRSLSEGLPH